MDTNGRDLLEIYRIHADLADRVSLRREGANRLYVTLLTGVLIFFSAFLRYGVDVIPSVYAFISISSLGIILSLSWLMMICSYRQLNSAKFAILQNMERELAYPFLTKEWDLLKKKKSKVYHFQSTVVEMCIPIAFFAFFLVIIIIFITIPGVLLVK